jgi:hypothetical protein
MKTLSTHLEEYLELRHKLGFKLYLAGGLLHQFVRFAQEKQATFITSKLALEWATQPADCQPAQWAGRLGMVPSFCQICQRCRSPHRDSAPRTVAAPLSSQTALSLHRYRGEPLDPRDSRPSRKQIRN